jgi:hypothetical protein
VPFRFAWNAPRDNLTRRRWHRPALRRRRAAGRMSQMTPCLRLSAWAMIVGALTFVSRAARADDAPVAEGKPAEGAVATTEVKPGKDPHDPAEDPMKAYRFIGLRFRDVIVPKFMINLFADGGATVNVPMVGPELTIRKDHFEYEFAIQYADYSMKPFMFKGHNDSEESYEIVSSSMKLLYFTVDLMFDLPIDSKGRFSFLVGGGVGLSPVFGNLYRAQAYPKDPNNVNPDDVTQWSPCKAPGNPGTTSKLTGKPFCDPANDHYGVPPSKTAYSEPNWFGGGSQPAIFPWISLPQLSLRYKPIKEIQTRLDMGFSITGFFFGLNAAYGL